MTIRTAEQLRKNLEFIQKDNEKRVAKLEARLAEIEEHNGNTQSIKRELEQARSVASASEQLAQKQLSIAEERELKTAQEIEVARKHVAAELENRQKFRAERTWIAAGGDPKAFEASWPTMREELLKQAVVQEVNTAERPQIVTSL